MERKHNTWTYVRGKVFVCIQALLLLLLLLLLFLVVDEITTLLIIWYYRDRSCCCFEYFARFPVSNFLRIDTRRSAKYRSRQQVPTRRSSNHAAAAFLIIVCVSQLKQTALTTLFSPFPPPTSSPTPRSWFPLPTHIHFFLRLCRFLFDASGHRLWI